MNSLNQQFLENRIATLEQRMKTMAEQAEKEMRMAIEFGEAKGADPNATTALSLLFNVNETLDELLLMASSIISEGIPEDRHREVAFEIARKVEKLDDWLSAGGQLPACWQRRGA